MVDEKPYRLVITTDRIPKASWSQHDLDFRADDLSDQDLQLETGVSNGNIDPCLVFVNDVINDTRSLGSRINPRNVQGTLPSGPTPSPL